MRGGERGGVGSRKRGRQLREKRGLAEDSTRMEGGKKESTSAKRARIANKALKWPTGLTSSDRMGSGKVREDSESEGGEGGRGGAPINIDAAVAWHTDAATVFSHSLLKRKDLLFPRSFSSAGLRRNSTLAEIRAAFAPHQDARVLIVGDLFFALWEVPDAPWLVTAPGDLPFERSGSCSVSTSFVLQPDSRVMRVGRGVWRAITEHFGPYIAVHWERRGEGVLCDAGRNARTCNMTTGELAGFLWRQLSLLDVRNVFFITDMNDLEVRRG